MTARRLLTWAALFSTLGVLGSCEEIEQVQDRFRDLTPHEAYLASLHDAGLVRSALGREWVLAARSAVSAPHVVPLPFREVGYLPPEEPVATGYRFEVERGQVIEIDLSVASSDSLRLFVDLFRVPEDPRDPLRPVVAVDSVSETIVYEPGRGGDYVLRVQPELLRGGSYELDIRLNAALAFPVQGRDYRAIQSVFGDPREGGRRSHNGVDIFARRGTPALAASDGTVYRVDVTRLGGKVVWIRDARRDARLYYAHLDSQHVAIGDEVQVGDTVGFVGNTGNAITTPPHLHFGIYSRGPVNPMPFLRPPRSRPPTQVASGEVVGSWLRARLQPANVRASPSTRSDAVASLPRYAPMRVMAASGSYYRVRLPGGESGFVLASEVEGVGPLREVVAAGGAHVLAEPSDGSAVVWGAPSETPLPVLGAYGGFAYVETPDGRRGWLSEDS